MRSRDRGRRSPPRSCSTWPRSFSSRWIPRGLIAYENDAFTLWASGPKLMYLQDSLLDSQASIIAKEYPPVLLVNAYFFLHLAPEFQASAIYLANYALMAAAAGALVERLTEKARDGWLHAVITVVAAAVLAGSVATAVYVMTSSYYSVMSEVVVPPLLALVLLVLLDCGTRPPLWALAPVVLALTLSRPPMMLIVPALLALLVGASLLARPPERIDRQCLQLLALSFGGALVWTLYSYFAGLQSTTSTDVWDIPIKILTLVFYEPTRLWAFLDGVWQAIVNDAPGNSGIADFSLLHWFGIVPGLAAVVVILAPAGHRALSARRVGLLYAAMALWISINLALYIGYWGVGTTSNIDRYFGPILSTSLIFLTALTFRDCLAHRAVLRTSLSAVVVLLLLVPGWRDIEPLRTQRNERMMGWTKDRYADELDGIRTASARLGPDDTVYILNHGPGALPGLHAYQTLFTFLPSRANISCFAPKFVDKDHPRMETCHDPARFDFGLACLGGCVFTNAPAFLRALHDGAKFIPQGYDYLYVLRVGRALERDLIPYLDNAGDRRAGLPAHTLYRLGVDGNGQPRITGVRP